MRKILLVILAFACVSPLTAQQSDQPHGAPLVWSTNVLVVGNYVSSVRPGASNIVTTFTPDVPVTISRIELQAAFGASKTTSFFPVTIVPCDVPPAIQVTDGTNSSTLTIPNAPISTNPPAQPTVGSASADSGPINLTFPAGTKISVVVLPGDQGKNNFCNAGDINLTIQYRQAPQD
jgi:hypothetical protein